MNTAKPPRVAGVSGTKKLRYDIWGEDVLTATLMESSGIPGEVCVSDAVLKHLEGSPSFTFERHTTVKLKTKTRDEWCEILEGTDVCFAPVLSITEAQKHPHNVAREAFVE